MRTLTDNVAAEVDALATKPGYFVEISFSAPLRASTRGEMEWLGNVWVDAGLVVAGLSVDGTSSSASAGASFADDDETISALVLNEGVADRPVRVWCFYGDSPDDDDPVMLFDGVCDAASGDPEGGRVTITFAQGGSSHYSPRRRMTREQGFSFLPAKGTTIRWNGDRYKLDGDPASS